MPRFPADFLYVLTVRETKELLASRPQIAALKRGMNIKYGAYAFTEQGVAMLSSVLHSSRAIEVNIAIMRAFVRMRRLLVGNEELEKKLKKLEDHLIMHDGQIVEIVQAIRQLMDGPQQPIGKIGY